MRAINVGYGGVVGGEPNSIIVAGTGVFYINPDGTPVQIGSAPLTGKLTLVAGTKAVALTGITSAANNAFLQLVTPATASSTVDYQAVITNNTLTVTALLAAKTINNADISTLSYIIY